MAVCLMAPVVMAPAQQGESPEKMKSGSLDHVEEIIFAERIPGNDHWYANFGYYWCGRDEYPEQRLPADWKPDPIYKKGGRLCRYNLKTKALTVLLDDPEGGVRDPKVHYDADRILFSYRKGGQSYYNLYEYYLKDGRLVQLTHDPYDDFEPTYLPDGGIAFCSSRCNRVVNCWRTPVANLYRCNGDGSGIRPLSTNIEHDNTPWVLPDGRILFMRWEYVDRSQMDFHHLWTINPDGTGQMVFFGNQYPGNAMLDAKPVPGSHKVVVSFSPGHGRPEHMGAITLVDPSLGPDNKTGAKRISRDGEMYRDPYAISEDCFLVANAKGILVMNQDGNTELICEGSDLSDAMQCHEPRPLLKYAREKMSLPRIDMEKATGQMVLTDVYEGRNMVGVKRGEIKKLLILEQLPKPVNFSGGMWPLSIGGSFTLSRVLGTVPVEEDGSASFEVPALRSLFLVALDENDLSVKRMQSFVSVQPGEIASCVGCHEDRMMAPRSQRLLDAFKRPVSRITPFDGIPSVLDFTRDVQPILDRHCVECHRPERYDGGVDLVGSRTPLFSNSYWTMVQKHLISDGRNEPTGNRPPRSIGSGASPLLTYLDGSHYDTVLSKRERDTVRLWIESSAMYAGTYAALGSGMATVKFPYAVMEKRCASCHGHKPAPNKAIGKELFYQFGTNGPPMPLVHSFNDMQQIRVKIGYFKFGRDRTPQSLCNLTCPEKSLLIRAPLAKKAGGLGLCAPGVFQDKEDPDYKTILGAVEEARDCLAETKRFDMAGFRPNDHYIQQMQRFGILPADLPADAQVDVYAADQAYWQSFWHKPE